jgi:glycosyltransferase involved in cell wall biosynthesis
MTRLGAAPAGGKLLFITDAWRPQVNGVVTALEHMKRELEKRGFQVIVIHPALFRNIPFPLYPEIRLALFPRRSVARALEREQPDYIHIATEGPLGLAARMLCPRRGLRFTTSYHTHFQLYIHVRFRMFLGLVCGLLSWFHKAAARTLVATPSLKTALEAQDFKNLALWPLGVDAEFFVRNPHPSAPNLRKPVFLFFSRLAPEKSPEEFLKLDLAGTKLVIGDGPDRGALEAKYGHAALFVGYKQGQELVDWLSRADVLVFPSRTETFGLVMLESLACGVPIAAHDAIGPKDVITHGIDGHIGEDLKEAALACLKLDPARCREKACRYTWEASADAFISHLELCRAERESASIA